MSLRARVASLSVGAPALHIVFDNVFDEVLAEIAQAASVESLRVPRSGGLHVRLD
jgi:hypothetical protein